MKTDASFKSFVVDEVMRNIDGVTARAMFGGWGIYRHGVFFALIADATLYFKVDEVTIPEFEKLGSKPFVYSGPKGKSMTMGYWELPQSVMDDPEEFARWVERSCDIAIRRNAHKK